MEALYSYDVSNRDNYETDTQHSQGDEIEIDGQSYTMTHDEVLHPSDDVVRLWNGDYYPQDDDDIVYVESKWKWYLRDMTVYCEDTSEYELEDDATECDYTGDRVKEAVYIHNEDKYCALGYAENNFYQWDNGDWYTYPEDDSEENIEEAWGRVVAGDKIASNKAHFTPVLKKKMPQRIVDNLIDFYTCEHYDDSDIDNLQYQYYNKRKLFTERFDLHIDGETPNHAITYIKDHIGENRDKLQDRYRNFSCQKLEKKGGRRYIDYERYNPKKNELETKKEVKLSTIIQDIGLDPNKIIKEKIGLNHIYHCAWGNNFEHKLKFEKSQDNEIETCQRGENANGYAIGFASAFTNGYLQPLLVYDGEKLVGRLHIREMFDGEGKKYLFIDRLYSTDGQLQTYKGLFYSFLMKYFLSKGYNVALPTYSQHETNSRERLDKVGHDHYNYISSPNSLRSGLYKGVEVRNNMYGYYHDSGTRTYSITKDNETYLYDRIQHDRYVIVQNKNNDTPTIKPKPKTEKKKPTHDTIHHMTVRVDLANLVA